MASSLTGLPRRWIEWSAGSAPPRRAGNRAASPASPNELRQLFGCELLAKTTWLPLSMLVYFKTNLDEAKYWLKKAVHGECEHKILGKADMKDAQKKLKEIEEHEKSNQGKQ